MIGWLREYLYRDHIEKMAGPPRPDESSSAPIDRFVAWAASLGPGAQVLEVGTKQWVEGSETHLQGFFHEVPRTGYTMVDVEAGPDVDVVADLHRLPADWSGRFDGFVACAVFEHLERPWIAAQEVARVLKPGGHCYIATHQTYPLHGFPSDFFRFSKEALSLIFADAGIATLDVGYQHRAQISGIPGMTSEAFVRGWNNAWPSYIGVNLFGAKPGSAESGA